MPNNVHWSRAQRAYIESLADTRPRRPTRHERSISDTEFVTRQEYRTLTTDERHRLFAAMEALRNTNIDGASQWTLLTQMHTPQQAPGAHWGPAFLPWHRQFLHRVERALREHDTTVSLPYWDTTLDAALDDPRDSVLWTSPLFGNGNGHVVTGGRAADTDCIRHRV